MNIYVSGSRHEIPRVREVMDILRQLGHKVTFDWTVHFDKNGITDPEYLAECALDDFKGVCSADLVVALFENGHAYKGTCAELGVAVARGIKVIVVGHAGDDCIFTYLKSVEKFDIWEEALARIKNL